MTAKKSLIVAVSSVVLFAAAPAFAATGSCPSLDEAGAKAAFDKWAAALPGQNPDLVLAFYAPEHSFKPHDAAEAMTERAKIREYWNTFVDKTPRVELGQSSVQIDCNTFVKSGVKTWTIGSEQVATNFTMEFQNQDGVWLISRHELNAATN